MVTQTSRHSFINCFKRYKELQEYIEKYDKVAIYGAGHQSLAVISLAEIGAKIEYVVDDATFKQGRYAPASNIPIVASNVLFEDLSVGSIQAVIVMAASYSDEVATKLIKTQANALDIAILRQDGLEIYNTNNKG